MNEAEHRVRRKTPHYQAKSNLTGESEVLRSRRLAQCKVFLPHTLWLQSNPRQRVSGVLQRSKL